MELLKGLFKGDTVALARLITIAENRMPEIQDIMKEIYKHTGNAHIIGITGAPGVGKSTLTGKLVKEFRKVNMTVGVIAIDPSSPFTGGALLGDRIRMQELVGDRGVFIRSMGTRGGTGGLAVTTSDVINILDAFKKDIILVETIGIGQDEIDIENYVHTLVVVTMPGGGDAVQCVKAGILEIGDIYAVNKSDHPEAERARADLEFMMHLKNKEQNKKWVPPIIMTVAVENKCVDQLAAKTREHYEYLNKTGMLRAKRIERSRAELVAVINHKINNSVMKLISEDDRNFNLIEKMAYSGEMDPYTAAEIIIGQICKYHQEQKNRR